MDTSTLTPGRSIVFGARWKNAHAYPIVDFNLDDAREAAVVGMSLKEHLPGTLLKFVVGKADRHGHPRLQVTAKWQLWRRCHGDQFWSEVPAVGLAVADGDAFFAGWHDNMTVYPMVAAHVTTRLAEPVPGTLEQITPEALLLREVLLDSRGWTPPKAYGDAARARSSKAIPEREWRGTFQALDLLCMGVTGRIGWRETFKLHMEQGGFESPASHSDPWRVPKLHSVLGRGVVPDVIEATDPSLCREVSLSEHPAVRPTASRTLVEWETFFRSRKFLRHYTQIVEPDMTTDRSGDNSAKILFESKIRLEGLVEELRGAQVFRKDDCAQMRQYMDWIEGLRQ